MAKNREVSQLGSFITVNDTTGAVGIANSLGVNRHHQVDLMHSMLMV